MFNVQYSVNLTVQSTHINFSRRPVRTYTSSASLGSIQPRSNYCAINYSFTQSITVYNQVLIYTAE